MGYKRMESHQKKILALSDKLVAEIEVADTLIVGVALYNFSISASLKLLIDLVCCARKTFAYLDGTPKGLMTGKKAIVCFSSGGTQFESDIDFASGYLRHILGFIGIIDVTFISADKHFMDSQSLTSANTAVDALIKNYKENCDVCATKNNLNINQHYKFSKV